MALPLKGLLDAGFQRFDQASALLRVGGLIAPQVRIDRLQGEEELRILPLERGPGLSIPVIDSRPGLRA
jgi:hypothetical protein